MDTNTPGKSHCRDRMNALMAEKRKEREGEGSRERHEVSGVSAGDNEEVIQLVRVTSREKPQYVIKRIREKASGYGFIIRDVFDMAEQFASHGVDVDPSFVFYSVMLCNPHKAYEAISADPRRGAVLLPPKQVVIYPHDGKTVLAYVGCRKGYVHSVMPEDDAFNEGLATSCQKIADLMRDAAGQEE